jgi:NAD(P)H-dependent flavin oxidoreductase YrpB (nitropropane dioxygenase family)
MKWPAVIQGGMGIGVSGWRLAKAVSQAGGLGVVSGTAVDVLLVRALQLGDPDGHVRRALEHFPVADIANRVLDEYFVPGGVAPDTSFRGVSMVTVKPSVRRQQLSVVANFVEVFLAKEGHTGPVGINYLHKILMPMLPSLYGAMLAGVDVVLVGAGIPKDIPAALAALALHRDVSLQLPVEVDAAQGEETPRTEELWFRPSEVIAGVRAPLRTPTFLAIVGSASIAQVLAKQSGVDGFVVEGPSAGGHVIPPRGPMKLDDRGDPIYGPKDEVDYEKMRAIGKPFWLAGSFGSAGRLGFALAQGASGVQIGTAFALCEESGIELSLKQSLLRQVTDGTLEVRTRPFASPTGFPFKMANAEGSVFDDDVFHARTRTCDIGLLRKAYRKDDGSIGYRCPAEPEDVFVQKGGDARDSVHARCLCNGLTATVGMGQRLRGRAAFNATRVEPALVTLGDDVSIIRTLVQSNAGVGYHARDVLRIVLQ